MMDEDAEKDEEVTWFKEVSVAKQDEPHGKHAGREVLHNRI